MDEGRGSAKGRPARGLADPGLRRAVIRLAVAAVMAGATLAIVGELVWRNAAVSGFGVALAVAAGAIYWVCRWLDRREAGRGGTA